MHILNTLTQPSQLLILFYSLYLAEDIQGSAQGRGQGHCTPLPQQQKQSRQSFCPSSSFPPFLFISSYFVHLHLVFSVLLFANSTLFFMLSSLNSTTTTNTDLYLYFLPPRPVFIVAPFPSPLIHKTDPSPSWRGKGGCCHKQKKRQVREMVKLSIYKSGKSSVLDRKCNKPRDKCRLHGRKWEKAMFENWDSRWKG